MKKVNKSISVNVAPTSNKGHYVENAQKVIDLDLEETESFIVIGKAKLVTESHTTLNLEEDCLINTQVVYNPFAQVYENAKD